MTRVLSTSPMLSMTQLRRPKAGKSNNLKCVNTVLESPGNLTEQSRHSRPAVGRKRFLLGNPEALSLRRVTCVVRFPRVRRGLGSVVEPVRILKMQD